MKITILLFIIYQILAQKAFSSVANVKSEEVDGELVFHERNLDTGVFDTTYNINAQDSTSYTALFHINHHPLKATDFLSFELIYATKFNDLEDGYLNFYISETFLKYAVIATSAVIPGATSENIISGGVGYGHRFKLIQSLFSARNLFETITAFASVHYFRETFEQIAYIGPGIRADYSIHKRSSASFHYGLRFSYNLASLQGTQDRYVTANWLSLAFELGFYL
ncbi:MAG: hypothetical protein ISR65_01885 [Bacteriovoracaceae bacterium]|nr:hypothetical protein [Bacteriovoracaceae bacterium]